MVKGETEDCYYLLLRLPLCVSRPPARARALSLHLSISPRRAAFYLSPSSFADGVLLLSLRSNILKHHLRTARNPKLNPVTVLPTAVATPPTTLATAWCRC